MTARPSPWELPGNFRIDRRTSCKTTALKRARSLARKLGYSEQRYTILARRRAGLCVLDIRFNGGPSCRETPSPVGIVGVLGWGATWRSALRRAAARLNDQPLLPPAVLLKGGA